MANKKNRKKSVQEEYDKMLEEAMKHPGIATLMEIMEKMKEDMERLEELYQLTQPLVITTTSAGTDA